MGLSAVSAQGRERLPWPLIGSWKNNKIRNDRLGNLIHSLGCVQLPAVIVVVLCEVVPSSVADGGCRSGKSRRPELNVPCRIEHRTRWRRSLPKNSMQNLAWSMEAHVGLSALPIARVLSREKAARIERKVR